MHYQPKPYANKNGKYVNMTDIISRQRMSDTEAMALIELMFFAYRDFVADADEILGGLGFGRAHHRVLHFVGRDPGMTVAQLLDILKITKQSLSRVLKDLIEQGYVMQKEGVEDRRQRLLYLTPKGSGLWRKLIAPQMKRFREAAKTEDAEAHYHQLLFHIIDVGHQDQVRDWIDRVSIIGDKAAE
jgi:DNA-binding MarR family transcriptional regulator